MAEVPKTNTRMPWADVPDAVKHWAGELLGERIVGATSQAGGFSPGAAERLIGARGARIFVKSVSRSRNRGSFELFRTEVQVWRALAGFSLPAPRLRGWTEHDDWITLAFEDVDGREPGGDEADIEAVFSALARLPTIADDFPFPPAPTAGGRSAAERVAGWSSTWVEVLANADALLPRHVRGRGAEFADLAAHAPHAAGGSRLAHLDLRPDNALLDAAGKAWLVDWPWAGRAAPWFDELSYLTGLASTRPLEQLESWTTRPGTALAEARAEDVDAVLSAQAGMLLWSSTRPSRLSGLSALQKTFALRLLDWLELRRPATARS